MKLILAAPLDSHAQAVSHSLRLRSHEVLQVLQQDRMSEWQADVVLVDEAFAERWDLCEVVGRLFRERPHTRFVWLGDSLPFESCAGLLPSDKSERLSKPVSPYELLHVIERPVHPRPEPEPVHEDRELARRAKLLGSLLAEIDRLDPSTAGRVLSHLSSGRSKKALDAAPSLANLMAEVLGRATNGEGR